MANALTASRAALAPLIVLLGVAGWGPVVAAALIICGATDFLDGYVARRGQVDSHHGARVDALADIAVLIAGATALVLLHPQLLTQNAAWLGATAAVYGVSLAVTVEPAGVSARVAGAALYGFALVTLLSGDAEPLLLRAALVMLAVSSLERIVTALMTIQPRARAKIARCQAPQAVKEVARSTGEDASRPISVAPITREMRL
jgi:phosphatidylglycerophosphate synthase